MLGNRYSQHSFAQVPDVHTSRSSFDRSFTIKDTFDFDDLVPVFVDEILPGDTVNCTLNLFARLSSNALKVPPMDNMYIDFFAFFVANRLVWDNWEKFNGAQTNPGDSTDYLIPRLADGITFAVGSLYDKMGLTTGVANITTQNDISALPFRGYNLIYNEWFRDQNLQASLAVFTDDGPDNDIYANIRKRNKRHDYFTSALPWPQKGPAVELPIAGFAPVLGIGKENGNFANSNVNVRESDGTTSIYATASTINPATSDTAVFVEQNGTTGYPNIRADLSSATAVTINELREAFAMQSLFELDARGGTRYVEILRAHFNVISPDFRLQRPEYLGGGSITLSSHPVAQTSPTSGSNAQGQLAAFGTGSSRGSNIGFTKSFVEHGYIFLLASARADISYQQGINRMWTRQTRYDFFWPKLSELGEQTILNKEIYAQGTSADDDAFGYQERYAEYRYMPSLIKGEFRSTYATSLDYWHMAEEFGSLPLLNTTFITSNTPIERALAVTDGPDILMDGWIQYYHARPMQAYSVPATIGRF